MDTDNVLLIEDTDYELEIGIDSDTGKTTLTITFIDKITKKYTVEYTTVVIAENGEIVKNEAQFEGDVITEAKTSKKEFTVTQFSGGTGSGVRPGGIIIEKHDVEDEGIKLQAGFKLWYLLNNEPQYIDGADAIHYTNNHGILEFENLILRTYYLQEVAAPEGYYDNDGIYELKLTSDCDSVTEKIPNSRLRIDLEAEKIWDGGPTPKPDIELQLYRDDEPYNEPVTLSDGTMTHTWTGLYKTDVDGNEYTYTVDEVEVPENYKKTIPDDSLTITNTYVSPKINITGEKIWERGPSTRPSIELQLYRDGEAYGDIVTLDGEEETPWTYTWDELDETDPDGNPYTYTIDEVKVPARYRKSISKDGLTITNRYRPNEGRGTEPEDPEDPTDPVEPKEPEEPEGPTKPEDPTDPEEPIVPEDPEDPEKPTETPKYEYPEVPDPNDPDSPDEFVLIEKEGVPLGTYTKHQKDDGTFVYLDKNKVPLGSESVPKTGDRTPILLTILIFIISLGTALYLIKHKNKLYN